MQPETNEPAVERFARVRPPAGHAERVAARTGPGARANTEGVATAAALPWRKVLPAAASVVLVIGAAWQSDRASRDLWFEAPGRAPHWSGKGVDTPVLPPRAYWEMSPFEEFETLRGGGTRAAGGTTPSVPIAAPDAEAPVAILTADAGAERPWLPLPPIELDDIAPAPVEVPAITGLEPLALDPIETAPIEIIPVYMEQK